MIIPLYTVPMADAEDSIQVSAHIQNETANTGEVLDYTNRHAPGPSAAGCPPDSNAARA